MEGPRNLENKGQRSLIDILDDAPVNHFHHVASDGHLDLWFILHHANQLVLVGLCHGGLFFFAAPFLCLPADFVLA